MTEGPYQQQYGSAGKTECVLGIILDLTQWIMIFMILIPEVTGRG